MRATWNANTPEPRRRILWSVDRGAVVAIDSVTADTRSVYLRGVSPGVATLTMVDSLSNVVRVRVIVE